MPAKASHCPLAGSPALFMLTRQCRFGGQKAAITRLRRHRLVTENVQVGVEVCECEVGKRKIESPCLILHERDRAVVRPPRATLELSRVRASRRSDYSCDVVTEQMP